MRATIPPVLQGAGGLRRFLFQSPSPPSGGGGGRRSLAPAPWARTEGSHVWQPRGERAMSARDGASGGPAPCGGTPRRRHNLEKAQQPPRARAQMAMENGEREMAGEHVEDLQIRGEPIGPSGAFLHTPHFRPPGDLRGLQEPARARGPRGSQGTLVSCVQFQKKTF